MRVAVCIPARLNSARLPGKLLLNRTGKTVLQHTCEAAKSIAGLPIVITPDYEIHQAIPMMDSWAQAIYKPSTPANRPHFSGTSRISECLNHPLLEDAELIVNVQGDEPTLPPGAVDKLILAMEASSALNRFHAGVSIGTLTCPLKSWELENRAVVKAAVSWTGQALYFSRAPLAGAVKHIGIYAYRRHFLEAIRINWSKGIRPEGLAKAEDLEQLSFLESGFRIITIHLPEHTIAIDTQDDYDEFCRWHAAKEGENGRLSMSAASPSSP